MKEELIDDHVTEVGVHSTNCTTKTDMKSKPIDDVEIGGVSVREPCDESDPLQMESTDLICGLPSDPTAMEVSEVQDCGPTESSGHKTPFYYKRFTSTLLLCDACGFKTDEKVAFEDHLRNHAEKQLLAPGVLECNSSSDHRKLNTQMLLVCNFCNFIGREDSDMCKHINTHLKNETPDDPSQVHTPAVTSKLALKNEPLSEYRINDVLPESSQPAETVTEDVGTTCSIEPLRLKVSGEYSQDSGPSRSSGPKEIFVSNKRFTCDVCGYKTNKKVTFEDHLRTHTGEKPFACDLCNYRSSSKHTLGKHRKIHTRPKPFKCDSCEYRGSTRSDLSRHMNTHAKSYSLHKGVFTPSDQLQVHGPPVVVPLQIALLDEGKDEPPSDPSPTIPQTIYTIFSYQPTSGTDVEPNVSSTGSSDTPGATAPELVWQSNSSSAVDGFEDTTTGLLEPTDDVTLLGSRTESSNDPSRNDMIQAHDGPPNEPLQMELSEDHSLDNDDTSCLEPEAVHTGNQCFTCDLCGYTTKRRHEFEVHLRTHTGETPFACDLCDKRYIAKKTLNRHKRAHHGGKPDGTANDRSQTETNCAQYEPTNDPLQLELSDEHRDDSSPSWSYEIVDTGNNRFTCDVCHYETQEKCTLEGHMMTHTGGKLFACEVCDRKYTAKRTVDRHMREVHGVKLFDCGLCDYSAPKKSDWTEHLRTHMKNDVENVSSEANEVKLASQNDLFEIELNEISNYSGPSESSQPGNDPLRTEFNETRYEPTNDPLQLNLSEEHSQDSSLSRNSEAEAVGGRNKRFTCDVCFYKTSRKYEFTVHMRTHTGEKPYGCSLCDYRSIKRSYVNKHMKTHLKNANSTVRSQVESNEPKLVLINDSPELNEVSENSGPSESTPTVRSLSGDEHFTCEHCDYKCDDLTAWSQHMFEHTRVRSYACDDCDYQIKDKGLMDLHRKSHAGKESVGSVTITCEFCDYLFTTRADMSQHIMTCHSDKCPHGCDLCDFKAFSVRSLELHKVSHTKPYACHICDYRFDEESLLSRHIMSAHGNVEEYVCYSCDYKASNVKDVERHISTAHSSPTAETASCMFVTAGMPLNETDTSIPSQPVAQQYLCYACDFKASEVAQVEEHILSTHSAPPAHDVAVPLTSLNSESPGNYSVTSASGLEEYICYACDYKASSVAQVQQHIQVTHNPPIPDPAAPPMDVTTEASRSITPL